MNITEMIKQLEEVRDVFGDVEVTTEHELPIVLIIPIARDGQRIVRVEPGFALANPTP